MATITLKDILGTDNVASSRLDIAQNFQTVQNSINTLEQFLNTTPAGGDLGIGNVKINLGANDVSDVLFDLEASGTVDGNFTVSGDFTVSGAVGLSGDISTANKLLVTGAGASPELTIGAAGVVPFRLQDVVFIDTKVGAPASYTPTAETIPGSGRHEFATADLRAVTLDYTGLASNVGASVIQLDAGVVGQRLYVTVSDHGDPADTNSGIYFADANFNAKYDLLGSITTYNGSTTAVSVGFTGTSANQFRRQWIELIYKGTGWEVYNAHPDTAGI